MRRTEGNAAVRDYPTLQQLRQVVLAEQERLAGQPQAALARLQPLARQDTGLVAVHWALLRSAQAAGDVASIQAQTRWFTAHRGRIFAERTTSEVLCFFNAGIAPRAASTAMPTK